ncbi:DUF4286 family protein [Herbiconiux daphne]|uniref:EthD family reductase n=1 Tax=Herbiconiux daphne TaxID=2970914 RepID=A0ABT2H833_9MICO|nr:DUF4286 family protein [Herbiconiux daphne]MCS5736059.1 hypothetical protein [Herbiconiux daphne]
MTTADQPAREVLIGLVNPVEGKDEEFRTWYWQTHIPEVLTVPGFVGAQCYRLDGEPGQGAPYRYATVYEVEGSAAEARGRLYTAGLGFSDLLDLNDMIMAPFGAPLSVSP